MDDDHYIANHQNHHIDTTEFEESIISAIKTDPNINDEALAELIYDKLFANIPLALPVDPGDDALICRYLTPAKFIQFLDTRQISFPTATQFSDVWECSIPNDYDIAVRIALSKISRSGITWKSYVRSKASAWNISCWTELDNYFDDHLMWEVYAGGNNGIGITIRYGELKQHIMKSIKGIARDGLLHAGRVNYETISLLPFNKHFMFRNEKEVRFAFQSHESSMALISIEDIFDQFGARISPAAEPRYRDTVRNLWLKYGGSDRIQQPE